MKTVLSKKRFFLFLFFIILLGGQFAYSDWQTFRNQDSTGAMNNSVIQNDTDQLQVLWKEKISGNGYSTPLLYDGNIYVSTAVTSEANGLSSAIILNWVTVVSAFCLILASWWKFSNDSGSITVISLHGICLFLLMILVLWGVNLLSSRTDIIRKYITASILISSLFLVVSPLYSNYLWKTCLAGIGLLIMLVLFKINLIFFIIEKKPWLSHVPLLALLLPVLSPYMIPLDRKSTHRFSRNISCLFCFAFFSFAALPVYYICHAQSNILWKAQPVDSLIIPNWYFYLFAGLLVLSGFLWILQRKWKRLVVLACLWTSPCILMLLGILGKWIVNSSFYLKYHVVRGRWDSIIGNTTSVIVMGILFFGLSIIALLKSQNHEPMSKQRAFTIFAITILCSIAICLSINDGYLATQRVGAIYCFDAASGNVKWKTQGVSIPNSRIENSFNSDATPTPIICNEIVVAYFGEYGMFGCSSKTGVFLWSKSPMHYESMYGTASSLAKSEKHSLVYIQNDSSDEQSISAFSVTSGAFCWKKESVTEESWRTPIVWQDKDREILCVWSGKDNVYLYQASDGKELLHITNIDLGFGDPITSPVYCNGKLYLVGSERAVSFKTQEFANGNRYMLKSPTQDYPIEEKETEILHPVINLVLDSEGPVCTTPALSSPYMIMISDMGEMHCFNVKTGAKFWKKTLQATLSSPLIAGNYIYTVDTKGLLSVIKLSEQYFNLQQLDLNEKVYSSLVTSYGKLYVRTENHLYCLGVKSNEANKNELKEPEEE